MSRKGSQFERDIARRLSRWWSGDDDAIFWRTSQSGGRATTRRKSGKATVGQEGDLCATNPLGQAFIDCFVVELKRGYNKFTIADLIDSPRPEKQTYSKWIRKIEDASIRLGNHWLLIVKRDRRKEVVFFSIGLAHVLGLTDAVDRIDNIAFVTLDCFLEMVSAVKIRKMTERATTSENQQPCEVGS